MAEALLRHDAGDRFDVASAGVEPTQVTPLAITAMNEIGIDIGGHPDENLLMDLPLGRVPRNRQPPTYCESGFSSTALNPVALITSRRCAEL